MKQEIQFAIDTDGLHGYTDSHLAALWHIGQANPAPIEDRNAAELAEAIGREIILRFLVRTPPELWAHQGSHHFSVAMSRQHATASAAEDHFVTVPDTTLPDGRFVPSFKYAKYPCSKGLDGKIVFDASPKPWVNINYHDAALECHTQGYQLSRETQELAIRLNVAQQDSNWTGGKVGVGKVCQGLHKGTVSSAQAADYSSDDPEERSWHWLSNGERVYGLAGNIWTWTFDDVQGNDQGVVAGRIAADSISLTTAPYPSEKKGMGYRPSGGADWSGHALIRGGYWHSGDDAGVFYLDGGWPGGGGNSVGFRCTKPA